MRKLSFIFFVAGSILAGSAMAGAPAPATYLVDAAQQQELEGVYKLSNGKTLRLTMVDDRLYADLSRHTRIHLAPTGPNTYASQGGAISISYRGEPAHGDIVLSYASGSTTAIAQRGKDNARFTQLAAR
jgi:hypothetical protein